MFERMLSFRSKLQTSERPPGIAAISVAFALLALASFGFVLLRLTGSVSLSAGATLIGGGLEQSGPLAFVLQGAIAAALAFGLWRGWSWSRLGAIFFAA